MMKSLSQQFLSTEEQQIVTDTVHRAELRTSGEIVPMVVSQSHSYPLATVRAGGFVALLTALLLTGPVAGMFWLEPSNMWVFLILFFPVYWGTALLVDTFVPVKRLFLSKKEMEVEVEEAAHVAFFTERLYQTRDANGILIFISILEHRAWIIADSGISERIPHERWEDAVSVITRGIREKKNCQALCQAIEMIGEILEHEFPIADNDTNELHNLLVR